jgi:hypothetical protein
MLFFSLWYQVNYFLLKENERLTKLFALHYPFLQGIITLTVSVLICFHFIEGGLPPNSCALRKQKLRIKNVNQ